MTPRKTELFNRLVMAGDALLVGTDKTGPAWLQMLTGQAVVDWMSGRIPDEDIARKIYARREAGRPLRKAEVAQLLRDKVAAGWRPKAIVWIGRWLTNLRVTLFRMFGTAFEFTSEIDIRYLRLTKEQSEAFVNDLPDERVGEAVRSAMKQKAQQMADDLGTFVEILDNAENIVGDAVPAQDVLRVTMSLAMRTGKVARGDWSRRPDIGPSDVRKGRAREHSFGEASARWFEGQRDAGTMTANPDAIDFDGAVMVEWGQLI